MKLTANNVETVIKDCLFLDEEDKSNPVISEGIMNAFGFHPERLESHREDIRSMLSALPDEFHADKGGGMSFLNACMTRDGEHWGEHPSMDKLFVLGQALGLAKLALPRAMWNVLPGGMPYWTVLL